MTEIEKISILKQEITCKKEEIAKLEQHLYLVAKEKMDELLPQIQEHYPDAILEDDQILIMLGSDNPEWVAEIQGTEVVAGWGGSYGQHDIWEDADRLIVKKPKPWWETQMDYYSFASNSLNIKTRFEPYKERINQYKKRDISQNTGKTVFKTKEEAQSMCDKLNAVLKGE